MTYVLVRCGIYWVVNFAYVLVRYDTDLVVKMTYVRYDTESLVNMTYVLVRNYSLGCKHDPQGVQKTITLLIGIYFYITTSTGMHLTYCDEYPF